MCDEYNGWTNWQTWLIATWLSDSKALDTMSREIANGDGGVAIKTKLFKMIIEIEWPMDTLEMNHPYTNFIHESVGKVNWNEVIKFFLKEA